MEQILKHSKYIDPMIDVAFKQIFGKEKNKRLIKELLEHVFHQDITELEFVNVEHPGESRDDRKAVFDLQCNSRRKLGLRFQTRILSRNTELQTCRTIQR